MSDKELEALIEEHWKYNERLIEYVYKAAFKHGFKHGVESREH